MADSIVLDCVDAENLLRLAAARCRNVSRRLADCAGDSGVDLGAEALLIAARDIASVADWCLDQTDTKEGE